METKEDILKEVHDRFDPLTSTGKFVLDILDRYVKAEPPLSSAGKEVKTLLQDITDEDAIVIWDIMHEDGNGSDKNKLTNIELVTFAKRIPFSTAYTSSSILQLKMWDYLRYKGYEVPIFFKSSPASTVMVISNDDSEKALLNDPHKQYHGCGFQTKENSFDGGWRACFIWMREQMTKP